MVLRTDTRSSCDPTATRSSSPPHAKQVTAPNTVTLCFDSKSPSSERRSHTCMRVREEEERKSDACLNVCLVQRCVQQHETQHSCVSCAEGAAGELTFNTETNIKLPLAV
jgi:hypothetical protein